jgi:hypothetical protein
MASALAAGQVRGMIARILVAMEPIAGHLLPSVQPRRAAVGL